MDTDLSSPIGMSALEDPVPLPGPPGARLRMRISWMIALGSPTGRSPALGNSLLLILIYFPKRITGSVVGIALI
jgi:hypothetical protein